MKLLGSFNDMQGVVDGEHLEVMWARKGSGFGSFRLYTVNGGLHIDSEGMSKNFVKGVMNALIDDATLDD